MDIQQETIVKLSFFCRQSQIRHPIVSAEEDIFKHLKFKCPLQNAIVIMITVQSYNRHIRILLDLFRSFSAVEVDIAKLLD